MEEWKIIEEFPDYEISSFGNCKKKNTTKGGYSVGKFIKPKIMYDKYLMFRLNKEGKQYFQNAHRLVAIHFITNPENKKEVNHKDCNKQNNRVENLEWVTPRENIDHAVKMGRYINNGGRKGSKFNIPSYYPRMTTTKEGKKEYMKHYRLIRKQI